MIDEKLKELIIATAYGDIPFLKRRKIMRIINSNEEAQKLYNEHLEIAASLNSFANTACPDVLVKDANSKIIVEKFPNSVLQDVYFLLFKRPLVTTAITLSIVFFIGLSIFNNNENSELYYTHAQIKAANVQTEQALAIIGKVLINSQKIVETNILGKQVGYPIQNSINEINNLFN